MKKEPILFILIVFLGYTGFGQSKTYVVSGAEMIFSFANIKDQGIHESSTIRWAPVLNLESLLNRDINQYFGLYSGIAIRNVGYIYDNYKDPENQEVLKKKFRSYNIGVPVGIKIGNLDNLFFYGGYEVELPILYKEKTFKENDKYPTLSGWFSDREKLFQHGLMAGIQLSNGLNFKFKYYLSEFHNQNFTESNGVMPYAGLNSHIYYFSLNFIFFQFKKYYHPVFDK